MSNLSKEHAQLIINAHELDRMDDEEIEMLTQHNPRLLAAYTALLEIASGTGD